METMKKQWGKALVGVQEFAPQEYIAACDPDATFVTYEFWCDASLSSYGHHVYFDDGDGVFDNGDTSAMPSGWSYSPCGKSHSVTVPKGQSIDETFPKGWLVALNRRGNETNNVVAVRIWQPDHTDYENTHCTRQLNEDEFTEHNPS